MAQVVTKTGPFVGQQQPTKSRINESRVWTRAPRPGPADYSLASGLGQQAQSSRLSTQGKKFGHESREGTLILPSARNGTGVYYNTATSAFSKQVLATKPTSPRTSFGTSRRENFAATYNAFTYMPH